MSGQFIRKVSLIVAAGENGIDLSGLRIVFSVRQWDLNKPNNALIRVYNVSTETSLKVQGEFNRVILQAGYENGAYGGIFDGTIVQVRRGREDAQDTYIDILAADGDAAYNFAIANFTLAAGATPEARLKALTAPMAEHGVTQGYIPPDLPATGLPRGKVFYGMARDMLRDLASTTGTTWSIQNGKLDLMPLTSYLPGEAIVLTAQTGMIGLPEQTQDGIVVSCLLNPEIKVNGRVQINNASIQRSQIDLSYTAINYLPSVTNDGFYRVIVLDQFGDTRGNDWYSKMTCIAVDEAVPTGLAVKGYG